MTYQQAIESAVIGAAASSEIHGVGPDHTGGWQAWSGANAIKAHVRVYPNGKTEDVPQRTFAQIYAPVAPSPRVGLRAGVWTGD